MTHDAITMYETHVMQMYETHVMSRVTQVPSEEEEEV